MYKDKLGQKITTGARIAYVGRRGSSCWLTLGTVLTIDTKGILVRGDGNKKSGLLTTPERTIVIQ